MLKIRPKRRSLNKSEEKESVITKRKKIKSESENEFDDDEEDLDSPMDNTDEDSDYNPTKEKAKSSSSEEEEDVETESKFFKTNSFGIRKKPPWSKFKSPTNNKSSSLSIFERPTPKQRTLLDSDSSSDEFERVPDSLDDLGGFERLNKEMKKEDSDGEMESDNKVTEYFDFSQIIQNQEVLKAAAIRKGKEPSVLPSKRAKQRSAGNKKAKSSSNDDDNDVMKLLALGEGAELRAKKEGGESDTDDGDDDDDNEKVDVKPKGVEVTIALPSQNRATKREKKETDLEVTLKKKFNLMKKEYQIYAHKVSLLCWIAHGNYLNSVLNCEDLMGVALSIIPSNYCYPPKRCDLTYLENFVKWFLEKMKIDPLLGKDVIRPDQAVTSQSLQVQFNKQMANSRLEQVLLFIATLRALGLLVRLIINFRPIPLKPPVKELYTFKKFAENDEDKGDKTGAKKGGVVEKKIKTEEGETNIKKVGVEKKVKDEKKIETSTKEVNTIKNVNKQGNNGKDEVDKESESTTEKKVTKNGKSKENEEIKSQAVTKRSSKRNLKKGDDSKNDEGSSSAVNKSSSKRNASKEDEDGSKTEENSDNLDKEKSCNIDESMEKAKQVKTRSKATSKSKTDESTNVEENVTRSSRRAGKVVGKGDESNTENNSGKTSTRNSRSSSKLVEKADIASKNNKVPEKESVSGSEKKGRTRGGSTASKKIDNESERGSRSRSRKDAEENDVEITKKSNKSSPLESGSKSKYFENEKESPSNVSGSTSKYFGNKKGSPVNNVNGQEIVEEKTGRGKRQKRKLVENLKEEDSSGEEEEEVKNKRKDTIRKSSVTKKSEKKSTKNKTESDEEFDLESSYFKRKTVKINRQVLTDTENSTDNDHKKIKKKNVTDEWAEVFLEAEEKWICVDLTKGMIHCVQQLYTAASQPVTHVLSWENDKSIKDVTRRYVPHYMTVTRKQRAEEQWWTRSLRPFAPPRTPRHREEDEDLDKQMEDQPLPTSISEYKNHPLYALQRHLLKFQAIYPPDAPTLGFIRNEPVYSRTCVVELHCRESWIKFAKVVRPGEEPYKMVKARPKYDKMTGEFRSDLPLPLFGPWQVDDYVPPPAKDGKVPRNEYGNVELFQPSMLPAGTVHIKLPGMNRVAKKLQIDCASAVVGWDFHGGSSHVVMDGVVVCEEFKDILIEAWDQEQREAEKRAREKMEQKVYGNWKRLIKGLLIREKLKLKYGFEIEDEVVAGSSGKGQKKGESSKKSTKK